MAKSALGKGLSALINTRPPTVRLEAEPGEKVRQVSVAGIVPSPFQPRKEFARETLNELVESIRQSHLRIVPDAGGSKLARLKRRKVINCDPEELVGITWESAWTGRDLP